MLMYYVHICSSVHPPPPLDLSYRHSFYLLCSAPLSSAVLCFDLLCCSAVYCYPLLPADPLFSSYSPTLLPLPPVCFVFLLYYFRSLSFIILFSTLSSGFHSPRLSFLLLCTLPSRLPTVFLLSLPPQLLCYSHPQKPRDNSTHAFSPKNPFCPFLKDLTTRGQVGRHFCLFEGRDQYKTIKIPF